MPRYPRNEMFRDGQYIYDDRHDAGEFITYGQSRGPSSNAYESGVVHEDRTSHSSARQTRRLTYDADGYPCEGAYLGEEDLRRRLSRFLTGKSTTSRSDICARLGHDDRHTYESGRRSPLSEQFLADEREERRVIGHRAVREAYDDLMRDRGERRAERDALSNRNDRRDAATPQKYSSPAYSQDLREQQQREYDESPSSLRGYAHGYFPARKFR